MIENINTPEPPESTQVTTDGDRLAANVYEIDDVLVVPIRTWLAARQIELPTNYPDAFQAALMNVGMLLDVIDEMRARQSAQLAAASAERDGLRRVLSKADEANKAFNAAVDADFHDNERIRRAEVNFNMAARELTWYLLRTTAPRPDDAQPSQGATNGAEAE